MSYIQKKPKSCKNSTKNSHVPFFIRISQMLTFWKIILNYLSLAFLKRSAVFYVAILHLSKLRHNLLDIAAV